MIAIMRLDRPDRVVKAERFTGSLSTATVTLTPSHSNNNLAVGGASAGASASADASDSANSSSDPPNLIMREAWRRLESVMEGFYATGYSNIYAYIYYENKGFS